MLACKLLTRVAKIEKGDINFLLGGPVERLGGWTMFMVLSGGHVVVFPTKTQAVTDRRNCKSEKKDTYIFVHLSLVLFKSRLSVKESLACQLYPAR